MHAVARWVGAHVPFRRSAFISLLCGLAFALHFGSSQATLQSITFGPGEPGTGNCIPFGCIGNLRYQQVYGASMFPEPFEIRGITFFNTLFTAGSIDPAHYTILFSVTDKQPNELDLNALGNNIGSSERLFFNGDLSGSLAQTRELTVEGAPFVYDPTRGNLLLEILKIGGKGDPGTSFYGGVFLDRFAIDPSIPSSRAFQYDGLTPDPIVIPNVGLVTAFSGSFVPEPDLVTLLFIGLASVTIAKRARSRLADHFA